VPPRRLSGRTRDHALLAGAGAGAFAAGAELRAQGDDERGGERGRVRGRVVRALERGGAGGVPHGVAAVGGQELRGDGGQDPVFERVRRRQERHAGAPGGGERGAAVRLGALHLHAQRRDRGLPARADARLARLLGRRGLRGPARGDGLRDGLRRSPRPAGGRCGARGGPRRDRAARLGGMRGAREARHPQPRADGRERDGLCPPLHQGAGQLALFTGGRRPFPRRGRRGLRAPRRGRRLAARPGPAPAHGGPGARGRAAAVVL
ncbi:MAG: Amidohydrolase EgtC (hercynylcysteine sulfoxide synthase), partial [uncultured Rubrobacteraceae bacterium]